MQDSIDSFTHDNREYDLTKVRKLTSHVQGILLPIKDLLWVLAYDKPNPERVAKAKIRYPLLVTRYKNRWCVVDGLHRLERYRQRGITIIPVKIVTPEVLKESLITKK